MASLVGFRTWDISETDWTRSQGPIVKVGGDTVIRAGVLSVCDGSNVFDYGFGASPTLTEKLAAGGAVVAGTYISAVTYEFASKNLTYRSDLSNVFTMSTSGGNLTIEMAAMRIGPSNKQPANGVGYGDSAFPKLSIKSYRSTIGGSELFERTIAPTYNMAISSLCQSADVFSDTRKDSEIEGGSGRHVNLSSRPGAYTNDGVLGDIQPPYFAIFTSSIGRLWGVQPGGREVWFSKRFDDDFSFAPGFVTAFRLQFDFEPTGLADLDDKIVIFGREKIAVVAGQGPTVTSGNNDFSPQYVQTDAGCTDPNSIATTPDGVIFRSVRGLMILTRGLTIERIGRPVQDLVDAYPLHISSALVAKDREVRLVLATEDGSAGVVLVYNYEEKQWTTLRYPFVVKQILPIGDDVYLMSKDGDVYKESDTDACDAGVWTSPFFETAWISANGPIDFQAVRRFALMGQAFSDHHLHVEISFDYEAEPYRVIEVDSLEMLTMARELDDLQITIGKRRKCNAIRFLVRIDQPDAGEYSTSKGVSFSAMGIEVALKKGLRSRPKGIKR
jgi:hypothetical protein